MIALAAALLLTAVALPTALRPPQQPPNASAELSPDAPPDPTQEAIVAALQRGTSGTAGAGTGEGAGPGRAEIAGPLDPGLGAVDAPPPRACPQGFGTPPRQVESAYSGPCAPSWQGDNGGRTHKGVTASEVRIGVVVESTSSDGMSLRSGEGPAISNEPPPNESNAHRTWRVYQRYFNENFQLWGRQLRFFVVTVSGGGDGPARLRAAVQELDEQYHVFGITSLTSHALLEAARRDLIGLGSWNWSGRLYADNQPHLVSWWMDGTRLMEITAEYLCRQLLGRPASYAGDPTFQTTPRRLGLITAELDAYGVGAGNELPGLVAARCGADVVVQRYKDTDDPSVYGTAISRFRLDGVTTVVFDADPVMGRPFLTTADSQAYFPEWFIPGTWANDSPIIPILLQYPRSQWSHAFGISPKTMARHAPNKDSERAYKTIDPANRPADSDRFPDLLQIVNGLQMAGPDLTPSSWRLGLDSMGKRGNDPPWSVGGGFAPGDHSYADDVAEIWWDDTAPNPIYANAAGSYRYVGCGRRVGVGTVADAPLFFSTPGTCTAAPGPD